MAIPSGKLNINSFIIKIYRPLPTISLCPLSPIFKTNKLSKYQIFLQLVSTDTLHKKKFLARQFSKLNVNEKLYFISADIIDIIDLTNNIQ